MRNHVKLWTIALTMMTSSQALAGEPGDWEAQRPHFFSRLRPKGGWNPDGRGMFHWWNPNCYPGWCGPDDYCRKPTPNVCRPCSPAPVPAYPPPPPAIPAPPFSPR
jgi:hypothetical protein